MTALRSVKYVKYSTVAMKATACLRIGIDGLDSSPRFSPPQIQIAVMA